MSNLTLQWGAHKALERLEWIDRHAEARHQSDGDRLATEIEELERFLIRVVEASAPRQS